MKTLTTVLIAALALVPLASAEAQASGPLGECSGLIDAACNPPQDCPAPASCAKQHCFVWVLDGCPLTLEDVEDLISG